MIKPRLDFVSSNINSVILDEPNGHYHISLNLTTNVSYKFRTLTEDKVIDIKYSLVSTGKYLEIQEENACVIINKDCISNIEIYYLEA
jgi:hypothetical protein